MSRIETVLRSKSIRPKMAVTVGFEPKEVRSFSFLLDRKPRITPFRPLWNLASIRFDRADSCQLWARGGHGILWTANVTRPPGS